MVFERTLIRSLYISYSIYFRMDTHLGLGFVVAHSIFLCISALNLYERPLGRTGVNQMPHLGRAPVYQRPEVFHAGEEALEVYISSYSPCWDIAYRSPWKAAGLERLDMPNVRISLYISLRVLLKLNGNLLRSGCGGTGGRRALNKKVRRSV